MKAMTKCFMSKKLRFGKYDSLGQKTGQKFFNFAEDKRLELLICDIFTLHSILLSPPSQVHILGMFLFGGPSGRSEGNTIAQGGNDS